MLQPVNTMGGNKEFPRVARVYTDTLEWLGNVDVRVILTNANETIEGTFDNVGYCTRAVHYDGEYTVKVVDGSTTKTGKSFISVPYIYMYHVKVNK